jgi:hypothetical protein
MTRRQRHLAVELSGAALRELLPWLAKLADWMDPSDTATQAWGPREVCPDVIPEYLTSNR